MTALQAATRQLSVAIGAKADPRERTSGRN
jgi:hypothetical protein